MGQLESVRGPWSCSEGVHLLLSQSRNGTAVWSVLGAHSLGEQQAWSLPDLPLLLLLAAGRF